MVSKRHRLLNGLVAVMAVLSFLVLASGAIVWANGLRYNNKTGLFEQTVLIAIDSPLLDTNVLINGQKVADRIPYRARNLLPDYYTVELTKNGFQTWRQSFWLSSGQIGLITDPTLIANQPLITTADSPSIIKNTDFLEFSLQLSNGELTDNGELITRFSQNPFQVHRFNDFYLYQVNNELRLFHTAGTQDYLIYRAQTPDILALSLYPSTWQIAVNDGPVVKLINLTIPGISEP